MSHELAGLFARRFIQRRDVKAVQLAGPLGALNKGDWIPDRKFREPNPHAPLGFKMSHLVSHIAGENTYGHYLLDSDSKCRLFAFDIDLEKTNPSRRPKQLNNGLQGSYVKMPDWKDLPADLSPEAQEEWATTAMIVTNGADPRDLWADRREKEARAWYKLQMKELAAKFIKIIQTDLDLPCAVAYSGSKGIHVYGFTGPLPADEVRAGAELVLKLSGEFESFRGQNFWRHKNPNPIHGYPSFSIEVFPKQGSVDTNGLGNLMRLPLGKNHKSSDPTFFLDMNKPMMDFSPHPDPVKLLETGDPFS